MTPFLRSLFLTASQLDTIEYDVTRLVESYGSQGVTLADIRRHVPKFGRLTERKQRDILEGLIGCYWLAEAGEGVYVSYLYSVPAEGKS
jgi:hypothetical protein